MEKRLFLAIALSFLIIYSFSRLTARKEPPVPAKQSVSTETIEQKNVQPEIATLEQQRAGNKNVTISAPLFEMNFDALNGAITSLSFNKYTKAEIDLLNSLKISLPGFTLISSEANADGFVNRYKNGDVELIEQLSFKSNYSNELKISVLNSSSTAQTIILPIILGRFDFSQKSNQPASSNIQDVTISTQEKLSYPNPKKEARFSNINFISMRNKYFVAIIDPKDQDFSGFIKPFSSQLVDVGIVNDQTVVLPGQSKEWFFNVYVGPQDVEILNKHDLSWGAVVYYGKFNFFAHILLSSLKMVHKIVHNWGIAIILVSIFIYLLLFPLTIKGFKTMRVTQELKPKIDQLQAQYKGDPQKLNRAMIELYKEHKINPLSGCLPFALQIPIFGAFFLVLSRLIEIKGANFLWIKDLSEPDRLFTLNSALPFIGKEINLLPILFLVISFIQQKFTPTSSGASAEQQKIFMVMTPVILGVVFYHMSAGLLLYSCINAALMVMQMAFMAKKA